MSNISVMHLAAQKAEWIATRQAVLAENIANVNSPNYRAKDVAPFEDTLAQFNMASSSPEAKLKIVSSQQNSQVFESGNSVSLENELMKIGENNSQYSFNTNIMKSFHRMLLSTLKG